MQPQSEIAVRWNAVGDYAQRLWLFFYFGTLRSTEAGVVVAMETSWDTSSIQRGGKYIWIYEPTTNCLFYYAHNSSVLVQVGDIVKPGNVIATVGRTGLNAHKKRSPTHLHFMELQLDKSFYPKPVNCYDRLTKVRSD